jgi:hypothetical protein
LSVGELLDRTFFFYRRHFLLFVGIAALPSVIALAFGLSTAFVGAGAGALFAVTSVLALAFVYLVTTALAQGATVVAVSQILLGRETNVAEAFGSIWSRIGELLILMLNMGVRIMLGFLLFIVPGVVLALMYALAVPVAVLEGKGISDSLSRSAELTKGHRWRILLIYVLLTVLVSIVTMLWYVPATIAVALTAGVRNGQFPLWVQVAFQFGDFVTRSVLGPIMTIAIALVYYDVRVRKEAFDLEHMMQQIDQSGLAPSPTT